MKNKYLSLIIILSVTFLASGIGGVITSFSKEPWYSTIKLPTFGPPDWVFAPVWTSLYILMAIAAWHIWVNFKNRKILNIYYIHLIFNGLWSLIFFGLHNILLALIDLFIILFFIILLMKKYYELNKFSFLLMVPYLLWSSFAFVLNFTIFILN